MACPLPTLSRVRAHSRPTLIWAVTRPRPIVIRVVMHPRPFLIRVMTHSRPAPWWARMRLRAAPSWARMCLRLNLRWAMVRPPLTILGCSHKLTQFLLGSAYELNLTTFRFSIYLKDNSKLSLPYSRLGLVIMIPITFH